MLTAAVDTAAAGPTVIVAGKTNRRIRVLAYIVTSHMSNYVVWKSGTTALSGQMHMSAGNNIAIHLGDLWQSGGLPVLQTAPGEDLVLYLDQAQVVGGHVTYVEVPV
jgi:hypothetical protein